MDRTVESRVYEPLRETKIGSRRGNDFWFELSGVSETEGSRNRDSTVCQFTEEYFAFSKRLTNFLVILKRKTKPSILLDANNHLRTMARNCLSLEASFLFLN